MFLALFMVGLFVLIVTIGGKTMLLMLSSLPIIGPIAAWYMGYVGQIGHGLVANMIYGGMAVQLVLMALAVLLYGPRLAWKGVLYLRPKKVSNGSIRKT